MPLRKASIEVIDQLSSVLESCRDIYTSEQYGSCIGKHIRHILDHYTALSVGNSHGLVDYNVRARDSDVEHSTEAAKLRLNVIRHWLVDAQWRGDAIRVESEISVDATVNCQLVSTLEREVAYVHMHTIHHLAQIRLLAGMYGVCLNEAVGLAPATQTFLRSQS